MKSSNISRTVVHMGIGACLIAAMTAIGVLALAQTPPAPSPATPPVTPPPTASPVPTSPPSQSAVAAEPTCRPGEVPAAGNEPTFRIYMPDGQLKSHSIRVYVARDILPNQNPRLRLLRSHAVTKKEVDEAALLEPGVVAQSQEWIEPVEGQQVRRSGTLLLFDISNVDFGYKAMRRVIPVVSWTEGGISRVAVGAREVNVANIVATLCWTALVVGLALLIVIVLSRRAGGNPLLLLTGVDGHLSLAQTQIACWTVVVGSVVLGYGLIRLEIPDIPPSLLALMGASLATGGIGFFKDAQKLQAAVNAGAPPAQHTLALGDLVRVFTLGQAPELSLAKGQMLFWTVLLLVLFVSKSILDGAIWEVPWALVALMGFSQTGYLAPKLAPQL
jgi:hypothetical protein